MKNWLRANKIVIIGAAIGGLIGLLTAPWIVDRILPKPEGPAFEIKLRAAYSYCTDETGKYSASIAYPKNIKSVYVRNQNTGSQFALSQIGRISDQDLDEVVFESAPVPPGTYSLIIYSQDQSNASLDKFDSGNLWTVEEFMTRNGTGWVCNQTLSSHYYPTN